MSDSRTKSKEKTRKIIETAKKRRREHALKFLSSSDRVRRRDMDSALAKRVAAVKRVDEWHKFAGTESIAGIFLRDLAMRHSHLCHVPYLDLFVYHTFGGYSLYDRRMYDTVDDHFGNEGRSFDVLFARKHFFVPQGTRFYRGEHPTIATPVYALTKSAETPTNVKHTRDAIVFGEDKGHKEPGLTVVNDVFEREIARCRGRGHAFFATDLTIVSLQEEAEKDGRRGLALHANAIVVDIPKRTLIRFEPHGETCGYYGGTKVDEAFEMFVKASPSLDKYVPPRSFTCGRDGPQVVESRMARARPELFPKREGQPGGFCMAYSMLFIDVVMDHPDWSYSDVYDHLNSGDDFTVGRRIRAYMQLIVDAVKERTAEEGARTKGLSGEERRRMHERVVERFPGSTAEPPGTLINAPPPPPQQQQQQQQGQAQRSCVVS